MIYIERVKLFIEEGKECYIGQAIIVVVKSFGTIYGSVTSVMKG